MVLIPEDYAYEAPNGTKYKGEAAYVLNALDSAEASMSENFTDLRFDSIFSDKEVRDEAELLYHISWLLEHPEMLAAYI
jgi:hypothetical protein